MNDRNKIGISRFTSESHWSLSWHLDWKDAKPVQSSHQNKKHYSPNSYEEFNSFGLDNPKGLNTFFTEETALIFQCYVQFAKEPI